MATVVVAGGLIVAVASSGTDSGGATRRRSTTTTSERSTSTSSAAPTSSTSSTSTTTTTMPPRAQPGALAPTGSGVLDGRLIVVDPGHNGRNFEHVDVRRPTIDGSEGPLCNTAGASTAGGVEEVDIVWEIGSKLTSLLRRQGATVVVTHVDNDGFGPCADERGTIAKYVNADAFVSLHADGAAAGSSGFHIIHPAPSPRLQPTSVTSSARLAVFVRDELVVIGGRPADYVGDEGLHERDDLANLNTADRPAVLAELGNLRNGLDADLLSATSSYEPIARAVARAVIRFLGAVPDPNRLSADIDGDGQTDLLIGAPDWMVPTTTTTSAPLPPPEPTVPAPTTQPPPSPTSSSSSSTTSPAATG
jgi:N-acetylmuramoyl-L-alanine amidase